MKVNEDECVSARDSPVEVSWSPTYKTWVYRGRRIAIAIGREKDPDFEVVATVLWTDADDFPVLSPERGRAAAAALTAGQKVIEAWRVPGSHPEYHRRMQRQLRREWPVLAAAIDELIKADAARPKGARSRRA